MGNQTIIINSPGKGEGSTKKTHKSKAVDKKAQAVKGAKIALSFHAKAMFKEGSSFLKHFLLTLFYALRLLGLGLQSYSKRYNEKNKGEQKKDGGLKW